MRASTYKRLLLDATNYIMENNDVESVLRVIRRIPPQEILLDLDTKEKFERDMWELLAKRMGYRREYGCLSNHK